LISKRFDSLRQCRDDLAAPTRRQGYQNMAESKQSISIGDSSSESLFDKVASFLPKRHLSSASCTLKGECLRVVRRNFNELASSSKLNLLSPTLLQEVISDDADSTLVLSPNVGASHIDQEGFWKRESFNIFGKNASLNGGLSWKRVYYEKFLCTLLEKLSHDASDDDVLSMVRLRNSNPKSNRIVIAIQLI